MMCANNLVFGLWGALHGLSGACGARALTTRAAADVQIMDC
jgi:hypothetical protein